MMEQATYKVNSKTLIMNIKTSTHYIYCFAHYFQLILLAVTKNHDQISCIKNDIFCKIDNQNFLQRFQIMKTKIIVMCYFYI